MHNFEDNKCWKPMLRKYRASVSLSGNVVDVLDVHNQVVASFCLSIKFGKVALEEQISHSLIMIPVEGDAESFSPFTYDPEDNTIRTTIMKTNGESQVFVANINDLMEVKNEVWDGCGDKHCHKPNHKPEFDKPHHKPGFDKPCDDLDPDFSYPKPPCDDKIEFEPEHCHKPSHKPFVDPYVTRSELMEESKKRKMSDLKIRDIIGENKEDKKSIFGHIDSLTSGLNSEVERSRFEDKVQKERLDKVEHEFDSLRRHHGMSDNELRNMLKKESDTRSEGYSELFRLINLLQADDSHIREKIERHEANLRKETQILRSEDRDLHAKISEESEERVREDKKITELIRYEETARHNAVKEALSQISIETSRASIAEQEIKQDMHKHIDIARKNDELLRKRIDDVLAVSDKKYQEKGDYVKLDDKGIILENTDVLYIESANSNVELVSVAKVDVDNNVVLGDKNSKVVLVGSTENPFYNDSEIALKSEIPSLENYVDKGSYNQTLEQVIALQNQLLDLQQKYKTLNDQVYNLALKVKELSAQG